MSELLGTYTNGNYKVFLYSDGTKERITEEDDFIPEFPETMDVCISTLCENNCPMCYANCSSKGQNADFTKYFENGFFDSIHPYTEIAININSVIHPGLTSFLKEMKERNIIVNATINQRDFEKHYDTIKSLIDQKLIWGLGISLTNVTEKFIKLYKEIPNGVLHIINGIVTPDQIKQLADKDIKLLILGYKHVGRGVEHYSNTEEEIKDNQQWLNNNLRLMTKRFVIISFDNLALEQLNVRRLLTKEEWNLYFMGNDGLFSFYINLVDGTFSRNSLSDIHYPINNKSVTECFNIVRKEKSNGEFI